MKLLTFIKDGEYAVGVKTDRGIIDVQLASERLEEPVAADIMELINSNETSLPALKQIVDKTNSDPDLSDCIIDENDIVWGPCVTRPKKIICIGLNYRKHAQEVGASVPEHPILFNKFSNALTGHEQNIAVPRVTKKLDYEAELVIVIGKEAKYVAKEEALDYVFAYCAGNDVSARDLQMRTSQWVLGKSCDGFCPIGPYLVTADEVGDPNDLAIRSNVNGETRQSSNTSDLIFNCEHLISYISRHMTLYPGDIILTGTPEGVIMGYPKERQIFLKPGDEVAVEIEKLGTLRNYYVTE